MPHSTSEARRRRKSLKRFFGSHATRIGLILISVCFNHDFVFRLIGRLNKKRNFLSTVFLVYPASREYYLAYAYEMQRRPMAWNPWPCLLFRQEGKWGLMVSISSTEDEFTAPANRGSLRHVVDRVEAIRRMLGAEQKTFAGILPGFLRKHGLIEESPETEVTVAAVLKAEKGLREKLGYPDDVPVIVLGGRGFIGRRLVAQLEGRRVISVDIEDSRPIDDQWPSDLRGKNAILINVTRNGSISDYVPRFWKELVLLNEVYPPPDRDQLRRTLEQECKVFHVVGISAKAYPSFPKAYQGGIPCCAARKTDEMQVIVSQLLDEHQSRKESFLCS